MTRFPVRLLAAALVTVIVGAGCTAVEPDADEPSESPGPPTKTASPPPPPPDPPRVGECRKLTYDDISRFSNDDRPRSCKRYHSAYTFAVQELPGDVAFDGVTIDNDAVQREAATSCQDAFVDFIGGSARTRTLARLSVTYFVPEQRGFDLGARWVRCDVVGLQHESSLAPLPRGLEGILDDPDALDEYGVCSRGEPGASGFRLVMCRADHDYRAIEAIRLGGTDDPYPGVSVARDDGRSQCEDIVAGRLGVGGGYTFGWTYPSPEDWSNGQRFGYCWLETSS
ncbi:MAG: septum formation family protein [Nocardioidaceae bacterium]